VILGEKGKAQLQRDSSKSILLTAVDYTRVGVNFTLVRGPLNGRRSGGVVLRVRLGKTCLPNFCLPNFVPLPFRHAPWIVGLH
jgi:hypothetical protein